MSSSCGGHSKRNQLNAENITLDITMAQCFELKFSSVSYRSVFRFFFKTCNLYQQCPGVGSAGVNCSTQLRLMPAFIDLKKNKFKGSILRIVRLAHETNETFNLLVVLESEMEKLYLSYLSLRFLVIQFGTNLQLDVRSYFKSAIKFNIPKNRRKLFWAVNVNI